MKSTRSLPKTLNNAIGSFANITNADLTKWFTGIGKWLAVSYNWLYRNLQQASVTPVLVGAIFILLFLIGGYRAEIMLRRQYALVPLNQNGQSNPAGVNVQSSSLPTTQPAASTPPANVPPIRPADHVNGNANAKVTLIEYSDYECPFCKQFYPTTKQILDKYGSQVALVLRHFPLPFHANAQKEAEASECVNELGGNQAFWKYTDAIFERTTSNGTGFALDKLGPLAAELGLNQTAFQQCLDSGKYTKLVQDQITEGTASGVSGTPTTFILANGKLVKTIPGALPLAQVTGAIDDALKQ